MPRVLLVNGLPGSGKSTLARALSGALGLPLYSKDVIKDTLFDWLGAADRDWSRTVGAAAAEVTWSLLADTPGDAIVESFFTASSRSVIAAGLSRCTAREVLEIWCDVPPEVALARYTARAPSRHPGHCESTVLAHESHRWAAENHPLAIGPVLRVPTATPVDLAGPVGWITRHWECRTPEA
jgi:predicted kinase